MTATPLARPAPPRMPTPPERAAGVVLAAGLGLVAWASGRKPLHAVGRTWDAELRIDEPAAHVGVPLLVDRGVHPCTARVSRAMSTRPGWWDIGGLAVRLPAAGTSGGPADLLLATTGTGRVSRYVLRPVRRATGRPLTTLLPTRSGEHSLALLARPIGDEAVAREFELAVSLDGGPWRAVGLLQLLREQADAATRFDPVVNELAGTTPPAWVVALREPAYRWARRLGRRHA
ncbi:phosphodiesterase [Terrabacter sp. Ter38]|uniref:phosphodiesterase n=1 Tax=Terrabacter sp. Ter38 TaxID=2926030 RepID=UPI002119917B|nr:phosphodiesterase [Terrabacter sp. Ter38]